MSISTVKFDYKPDEFGTAGSLARQWFEVGWDAAGGWLRKALAAHPLPEREVTDDLQAARIHKHYPAIGKPFLLLGARTAERGEQDWNRLYTETAWRDFLLLAETPPHMSAMILGGIVSSDDPMQPPETPADPFFSMDAWFYTQPMRLSLEIRAASDFLIGPAFDSFIAQFADVPGAVQTRSEYQRPT